MTKKSASRQARDQAEKELHKKGSSCWDDLTALYQVCDQALVNAIVKVKELYSEKAVRYFIENKEEVAINLRGLADDNTRLKTRLDDIYNKHKHLTGGVSEEEPDTIIESLQFMGEYEQWQSDLQAIVLPTVEYLISEYTTAYEKLIMHVKEEDSKKESESKQELEIKTE